MNYSNYAIALKWEIINNEPDIGKWELFFEKDSKLIAGFGMNELIEAFSNLDQSLINVIYVRDLNYFQVIGSNYFSYTNEFMAVVKEENLNFFNLKLFDWIELINWNNYFDTEDCKEFIRQLSLSRENFKGRNKNRLGFKNHYRLTKAADQWFDLTQRFYLKSPWASDFRTSLLPQSKDELDLFLNIYKGSYAYINSNFIGKTTNNVKSYDISSSHSGFILRKKYPASSSEEILDNKEVFRTIDSNWFAWIGELEFENLYQKIELPMDLRKFGFINKAGNWVLTLTNVHWDTFKRIFGAENIIPHCFYRYQNRTLPKNYASMIHDLYREKEYYKTHNDNFVRSIFKFRTELPFGQSIKSPQYFSTVLYNEEANRFVRKKIEEQSYETILERLKNYVLPMQVGIWTAAYSWAEEINMILDIGVENVVYGDTDCVKFIGDYDSIVEQHNKEIDEETDKIMPCINKKIGRWKFEGINSRFKAIGLKWYLSEQNGEIDVKAAGANSDKLLGWLKEHGNCFDSFEQNMHVPGLFKNVKIDRDNGTIFVSYNDYIDDSLKKEIELKTNGFSV